MARPLLNVKNFHGCVVLHDWMRLPNGRMAIGFIGRVTVMSDTEAVGFEAKGHNSANWLARVEGATSSVNVLGCQIRGVIEGPAREQPPGVSDFYVVP